jgi:excisionase family DNA binding protein
MTTIQSVSVEDQMVASRQAAREAGVCEETIRRKLRTGELRGVKIGTQWLIYRDALAEMVVG